MPKRRFKSSLHRMLHKLGHRPGDLMKILPFLCLVLTLSVTLAGFGGFMEYAGPLELVSYALLGLTGTHALVVLLRKESLGFGWEAAFPVPFVLLAVAHFSFHSPVPWMAGINMVILIEAYIIFLLVYNSILGRPSALSIIMVCEIVVMLALAGGFYQFYLRPEGLMPPGRMRIPEYSHGMGGFLMDPQVLASLLLLMWPLTVMIAWIRRFPPFVRVFNAFGAIAIPVGIIMSANRWGALTALLVFYAFPFFLTGYPWIRRKLWLYQTLGVAFLMAFCWYATEELQLRMMQVLADASNGRVAANTAMVAMRAFLEAPVLGQGLGSFGTLWESFNMGSFLTHSVYADSGLLHLLAEAGLSGILLAMFPLAFFLFRAFRKWRQIPHVIHDPDILRRLKHIPSRKRVQNKLARKQSHHSSHKILLGGLLLGIVAFLILQLEGYSILFPLHLFLLACLTACLAVVGNGYQHRVVTRPIAYLAGIVPLSLAIICCLFGVPRFQAQYLYYTNSEKLRVLLKDTRRIFDNPLILEPIETDLERATALNPRHGGAWIALAECRLGALYSETRPVEIIASSAEIPLVKASETITRSWKVPFQMARTSILRGEDPRLVTAQLERARELAPGRPEPDAFLGILLLMDDPRSERGHRLLQEALVKYPRYELVFRLKSWLHLSRLANVEMKERTVDGSMVTPAFIAGLFAPLPDVRERVMGAGLPIGDDG